MPQTGHRDLEEGGNPGSVDGHRNQYHSMSNQPTPNQPLQPSQGEFDYGDSSRPLYLMYSKIAEDEDNKMVERCQKYTDGTLIFSGLFSATVGALLAVSIPDLKPNPLDTSAFYLENIYQVLGSPNDFHPSISSTLAKPPAFSPPRYAIWVNSLWFLSLAISLSGAMRAMVIRNWAVYYTEITQWPWDTLTKRARMRAIFAKGQPGPYIIWGTGKQPMHLHFSLLLFIAGGVIYLFNINRAVFYAVVWWVGYMTIVYASATLAVFFGPHDLLHTPLSPLVLRIYLGISYAVFQVCSHLPPLHGLRDSTRRHYLELRNRYNEGILIGKRRAAEEVALKPSSEIDSQILERILPTLDEDHALGTFFDAIPGFCNSKLSDSPLSFPVRTKLQQALDGFLDHTFSSNLVPELARASRLITCLNAAHAVLGPDAVSWILDNIFDGHWDEAQQSVEIGHALKLWGRSRDDLNVQRIVACIIVRVRRRDDRWTKLVEETFDVPDRVLPDYLAHGDSVLLFVLIHISRQANRAGSRPSSILSSLSRFDIRNTLPELQHEFCAFWNEVSREAMNQGSSSTPAKILHEIRHLYIALHQNTDAASTPFSASAECLDFILDEPSSYPLCDIPSHCSDASPHKSTLDCGTSLRLAEETYVITGLPSPPTTGEIGQTSQASTATFPVHSNSPSSDKSSQDVASALQDAPPAATLSHPQGTTQLHIVAPRAEPDDITSTPEPTPALAPVPASSCDADAASTSGPLLASSSAADFSIPASPPPSRVLPFPNAEFLALLGSTTLSRQTSNATFPRLRARGLVNTGNMRFANAVLQLLVYSPPFWSLFRELGYLKMQRRAGSSQTCGGATPLVDATVRFFEEFVFKEEPPPTQQSTARGNLREDGDENKRNKVMDSFEPTYMYDAMKEKMQLRNLLDGRQQDAEELFHLYLDALNEELFELLGHSSAPRVEEREVSQSGPTDAEKRNFMAESVETVESPLMRIFSGKFRSTVRAPNQPDTVTIEDWRSLQLDIQHDSVRTVKDALARISHPQPAQLGPSGFSDASQQLLIEVLPPVLVLHLKRFLYGAAANGMVKISKPVQFGPELEIPLEIMAPVALTVAGKSAEPAHYRLHGVLYHHGDSSSSGHYTVNVLHPNGGSGGGEAWLHIDGEAVSVVRHEDVFGGLDNERVDDRCAYMLFYCRTASSRTS